MSIPRKTPGQKTERKRRAGRGEDNRAHYEQLGQEIAREAQTLCQKLADLEDLIALQGELLRISQPPMPGKYDIRWWRLRGWLKPVLVKWIKPDAHGRLQVQKVQRQRYRRSDHGFALNAQITSDILDDYNTAQARLSTVREQVARSLSRIEAAGRGIDLLNSGLQDKMESYRQRIVENLLNAGYAVEEKYRSLETTAQRPGTQNA